MTNKGSARKWEVKLDWDVIVQVWAELNYATFIERKNPLLDELCGQFGLTPEDVDGIFGLN